MFTNASEQSIYREKTERVFPVNTSHVPDYLKQLAKTELNEDEDTAVNSLRLFKSMLREQTEFTWQDDDVFLLAFLRARKFDVTRAFNLMKNYYTVMDKYEKIFYNFEISHVKRTLQHMKTGFLPYRDSEGCAIFTFHPGAWDPRIHSMSDNMLANNCLFQLSILSPATQIAGYKMIVDCTGFSFNHVRHLTASDIFLSSQVLQNFFPSRFRSIHVVNGGVLFSYIWSIFKQFLSKKIKERLHFHGNDVKELHKYFSPSILPADYEGELPPYENSDSLKEAEEHADYLAHVFSFGFPRDKSGD